jgi:2-polyprenyl-6-methoxyphenol hydroxylase-like FAD-dependent oxidoreductase
MYQRVLRRLYGIFHVEMLESIDRFFKVDIMTPPNVAATKVVIVGAGPAGLAMAIELGSRSIPCMVIERNDRVGYAPRAKTTNVRTREHLRRWGIAGKLAEASPLGLRYPSNVMFVTRLAGYPLAKFENAFYCAPEQNPLYSEHAQWIPQYALEQVLRTHAETLPCVEFRFGTELESFVQDEKGVTACVRDLASNTFQSVSGAYLVGADGARSKVREWIGARMEGKYGLSRNYNIVFRAPGLAKAHKHGPAIMYWQINADIPSLIGPMDDGDVWFFMPTNVPADLKLSSEQAVEFIRAATGIDLPYEILSTDEWVASRLIANKYRDGRAFLVGDACHLHPPFGGYGMNMGIADSVDLGWKIAAMLQGWGGSGLSDSYETERRPVHIRVMDEAVANHSVLGGQLSKAGIEDATEAGQVLRRKIGDDIQAQKIREFRTLGVVLGYRYDSSPLIVEDGSPAPADDVMNFVPSARPGCLAPHAWLGEGYSLYDTFGAGFTLLAMGATGVAGATADIERARRDAAVMGIPLAVHVAENPALRRLYRADFALIRPDQHIAWRGDNWPEDGLATLHRVTGHALRQKPELQGEITINGGVNAI